MDDNIAQKVLKEYYKDKKPTKKQVIITICVGLLSLLGIYLYTTLYVIK